MSALSGPVFTIFTPFTSSGEIDFVSIERYIEFLTDRGARQFYMMPYNGRYSQLTNDEILRLNAFCIRCVKSDPGNTVIVSDPIHGSTETKLEFARQAQRHGADYFSSLLREKYFSAKQVAEHYATLADAGIKLVVHAMPFLSGYTGRSMDWPEDVFDALSPNRLVAAVKEDSKDVALARGLIKDYGDRFDVIVAGRKRFLVDVLGRGEQSYINGISMLDPQIAHVFWSLLCVSATQAMEYAEVVDDPFWEGPVAKFGWHRVNKAALESCGLMSRRERRPMPELDLSDMPYIAEVTGGIFDAHRRWIESNGVLPESGTSQC